MAININTMRLRCHIVLIIASLLLLVNPASSYGVFVIPSNINLNRKIQHAFRFPQTKLSSRTPLSSIEEGPSSLQDRIACAASVVSYQCAENRLGNALEYLNSRNDDIPQRITRDVRGRLEDYDEGEEYRKHDNIVDVFLSTLASTMCGRTDLQAGLSVCEFLVKEVPPSANELHDADDVVGDENAAQLHFMPPTRSLVGNINGIDVALLRDKEDVDSRFSMLFSIDKAKGLKIARLLAEIDKEGVVHIRGMHVQEAHRKKGLATLLLAFFSQFCKVTFGAYPRTLLMNKPVICVALESLGFTAENKNWPVFVAQHKEKDKEHVTLMMAANNFDLGPQFPHAVRRAQNIEFVLERPEGSRRVHVLTKFYPPNIRMEGLDHIERRLDDSTYQLYSARIIAFLATVGNAKNYMFRKSQGLAAISRVNEKTSLLWHRA